MISYDNGSIFKIRFFSNSSKVGQHLKSSDISQKKIFLVEYLILYIHVKFLVNLLLRSKIIKEKPKLRILYIYQNFFNYFIENVIMKSKQEYCHKFSETTFNSHMRIIYSLLAQAR